MPRLNALLATLLSAALLWLALALPARAQWTNDPINGMVPVCTADGEQAHLRMCQLAADHTFYAWTDERSTPHMIHYQVSDVLGNLLREINGEPIVNGSWTTAWASAGNVLSDGEGGCIAIFEDYRSGPRNIYGQRFDSLGNRLWGPTGLQLVFWSLGGEVQLKDVESDGQGGCFIGYGIAYSTPDPDIDIYVQKINSSGQLLWGSYGVPIHVDPDTTSAEDKLVSDGHGGVMDVWKKYINEEQGYLWAQHFDSSGNRLWQPGGIPVRNPSSGNILPGSPFAGVPDGFGGGIWAYSPPLPYLMAFRLLPIGRVAWLFNSDTYWNYGLTQMLRHPADGSIWLSSIVNWPNSFDPYVFRLAPRTGFAYFGEEGVPWGGQTMTAISDGVISFFVPVSSSGGYPNSRLKTQRISRSGRLVWQTFAALCGPLPNHNLAFWDPKCVSDGADGAICAWEDLRNYPQTGIDIYAQRVRSDGQLGNPTTLEPDIPGGQIGGISQSGGGINYHLIQAAQVKVELFDILGRCVALLEEGYKSAGTFSIHLEQFNLPSGVYLVSILTPQDRRIGKVVIWH